ncbi:MAG: MFS transporter [Dehalococcoidia bacterium]|nr:MAG: MFS transporter [Dehalococcoidia bacterium]
MCAVAAIATTGSPLRQALRLREYRLLLGTQLAVGLTQPLLFFTQGWYVTIAAPEGKAVIYLGALGASRGLAFLTYVLFGGTFADRFPRRRVLIVSQFVSLVMTVTIGMLLLVPAVRDGEGWLLPLMIGLFATFGLVQGQDGPTRTSMLRDVVPEALLSSALSLFFMIVSAALLLAAPFSGWSLEHLGVGATYLISATGPAVILLCALPMNSAGSAADPDAHHESVWENLLGGLDVLAKQPAVRWTVLLTWLSTAAGLSVMGVLIGAWVKDILHLGASGWGTLALFWGVGSVISTTYLMTRPSLRHRGWLFLGACGGLGAAVLGFSLTRTVPIAFAFNALAGVTFMVMNTVGVGIVQAMVPNRVLGRVTGLLLLGGGLMQVTGLLVGLLAAAAGIERTYTIAALVIITASTLVTLRQRPLRELD